MIAIIFFFLEKLMSWRYNFVLTSFLHFVLRECLSKLGVCSWVACAFVRDVCKLFKNSSRKLQIIFSTRGNQISMCFSLRNKSIPVQYMYVYSNWCLYTCSDISSIVYSLQSWNCHFAIVSLSACLLPNDLWIEFVFAVVWHLSLTCKLTAYSHAYSHTKNYLSALD